MIIPYFYNWTMAGTKKVKGYKASRDRHDDVPGEDVARVALKPESFRPGRRVARRPGPHVEGGSDLPVSAEEVRLCADHAVPAQRDRLRRSRLLPGNVGRNVLGAVRESGVASTIFNEQPAPTGRSSTQYWTGRAASSTATSAPRCSTQVPVSRSPRTGLRELAQARARRLRDLVPLSHPRRRRSPGFVATASPTR